MWSKMKNVIINFYKFMEEVQMERAKAIAARFR